MSELPKGWAVAAVEEVTHLLSGPAFRSEHFVEEGLGVRLLRGDNIEPGSLRWRDVRCWPPGLLPGTEHLMLQAGDSIVAMDRPVISTGLKVAQVAPADLPALLVQRVARLRGSAAVTPRYLYLSLLHPDFERHLTRGQTGTQLPHVSLKQIGAYTMPVPPLAEQERIVTAIEEAFSKLDAGEVGLRTVRQLLKRMREAILTAAVTGRLVPQDPTDTPAAKLLADLGVTEISPPDAPQLPAGWCWAELGDTAFDSGYGTSVKCSHDADGPGVLRIPNIRAGRVDLTDLKRAPASAMLNDSLLLAPGDLLIIRTNGSQDLIGRCAAVTASLGCSFASYLIRFRLRTDLLDGSFASLQLSAQWWRRRLESIAASSAGQYNLSLSGLAPTPIALPPPEEQSRIVAEVERQFSFVDACERAVDIGLARSAGLRRSVLKAAFEGRLVPQDPSDEPATVLLARIRAERAAQPIAKRRARQTA